MRQEFFFFNVFFNFLMDTYLYITIDWKIFFLTILCVFKAKFRPSELQKKNQACFLAEKESFE